VTTPAMHRARAKLEQAFKQLWQSLHEPQPSVAKIDFDLSELARQAVESRVDLAGERQ
jgi:hypothetical protein